MVPDFQTLNSVIHRCAFSIGTSDFPRANWSRAMFDESTNHGMTRWFGYLVFFLAQVIFRENSTEMALKTVNAMLLRLVAAREF